MTYDEAIKTKTWLTNINTAIRLEDMSNGHLISSLKKCERENWRTRFIPLLQEELASRGFKQTHPELFL